MRNQIVCSATDFPPYDDAPTPQRPRRYELSGDAPEPALSPALQVLDDMIGEAEEHGRHVRVTALRTARVRIAEAESR